MKTIKELFEEIVASNEFPEESYQEFKEREKESKRLVLKILKDYTEDKLNYSTKCKNKIKYIFPIMYVCENKIKDAFPFILNCFCVNAQNAYYLYEELINDIPTIIYNTYNGEYKLIETFMNNQEIDESIRNAALCAYCKLTREKEINKRVFNNFVNHKLEYLNEEVTDEKINALTQICNYSAEYHIYSQLLYIRKVAYSEFFDETVCGDYEHYVDKMFSYDLETSILENYSLKERCMLYRFFNFENTKDLENIKELQDKKISPRLAKKKEMMTNYINACTIRKPDNITKNDLCFCGSGLKYKKCCMGKRDYTYVYKRLEDYYDLLIDYPEENNIDKEQKGLISMFSLDSITMDKLFYKAFHKVNVPNYIPHNYQEERLNKASYILSGLDIALNIVKDKKIYSEEEFNLEYMIHYDIFYCLNEAYKIIHDEHYPLPQLNEKIKDLIFSINKYFKGTALE